MSEEEISVVTGEIGTLLDGADALSAIDRASIDVQVATAKQYPRSVDKALKEATTLATLDEETAAGCLYALPRSGKNIEGPSVRLAEIVAYSWGNLRIDADIVAEDKTHITAMGTCFDLEKNVAVRVRVKRRIVDKHGRKYNADMIGVTSNAAISIALRNAIFKVIPRSYVNKIYGLARTASLGQGGTITQKRQAALEWYSKLGVQPEQIFELLEVRGLDDIGEDQLITLRGLMTSIQDGETTVERTFSPPKQSEKTETLNEALKGDENSGTEEEQAEEPAEENKQEAEEADGGGEDPEEQADGAAGSLTEAQKRMVFKLWRGICEVKGLTDKKRQEELFKDRFGQKIQELRTERADTIIEDITAKEQEHMIWLTEQSWEG